MLAQRNGEEAGSRVSLPALEKAKDGPSILIVEWRSKPIGRVGHPPDTVIWSVLSFF